MKLNYNKDFEWLYGLFILGIICTINFNKIKKLKRIDKFILISFYVYLISLFSVVFFPIPLYLLQEKHHFLISNYMNLVPFKTILIVIKRNQIQLIGNILLLMPLGIYYPLLIKKRIKIKKVFVLGFSITFIIEIIQLLSSLIIRVPYRIFDIDDIICNLIGMIVGFILFKLSLFFLQDSNINSNYLEKKL